MILRGCSCASAKASLLDDYRAKCIVLVCTHTVVKAATNWMITLGWGLLVDEYLDKEIDSGQLHRR